MQCCQAQSSFRGFHCCNLHLSMPGTRRSVRLHALECELRCCLLQEYHELKLRALPGLTDDLAVLESRILCDKYGAHVHDPVPRLQAMRGLIQAGGWSFYTMVLLPWASYWSSISGACHTV